MTTYFSSRFLSRLSTSPSSLNRLSSSVMKLRATVLVGRLVVGFQPCFHSFSEFCMVRMWIEKYLGWVGLMSVMCRLAQMVAGTDVLRYVKWAATQAAYKISGVSEVVARGFRVEGEA